MGVWHCSPCSAQLSGPWLSPSLTLGPSGVSSVVLLASPDCCVVFNPFNDSPVSCSRQKTAQVCVAETLVKVWVITQTTYNQGSGPVPQLGFSSSTRQLLLCVLPSPIFLQTGLSKTQKSWLLRAVTVRVGGYHISSIATSEPATLVCWAVACMFIHSLHRLLSV